MGGGGGGGMTRWRCVCYKLIKCGELLSKNEMEYKPLTHEGHVEHINFCRHLTTPEQEELVLSGLRGSWFSKHQSWNLCRSLLLFGARGAGEGGRGTRPIFGYRWDAKGLKPWPCLGQKNPKIHTLFRITRSILLLCLWQRTKWTRSCIKAIYWQLQ